MGPDEACTARHKPSFRLTPHFSLNRFVIVVLHDKTLVRFMRMAVTFHLYARAQINLLTNNYARKYNSGRLIVATQFRVSTNGTFNLEKS